MIVGAKILIVLCVLCGMGDCLKLCGLRAVALECRLIEMFTLSQVVAFQVVFFIFVYLSRWPEFYGIPMLPMLH